MLPLLVSKLYEVESFYHNNYQWRMLETDVKIMEEFHRGVLKEKSSPAVQV